MDLPVILIKFRDYLLWFGPAYLVALGLGAAAEVALRRLLGLPEPQKEAEVEEASGLKAAPANAEQDPFLEAWLRLARGGRPSAQVSDQLYVWALATSQSVSWLALLVTAQISWPLAVARLGLSLIMASVLAAPVPLIASRNAEFVIPGSELESRDAELGITNSAFHIPKLWWRVFQRRFASSSNDILIAAGLGALLFGLGPGLYSILHTTLAAPLSYLWGAAAGIALPLASGTDAPLMVALQTKGADNGAVIALMLAVSATPWGLLRRLKASLGARAMLIYMALALLLASVIAALLSPLFTEFGLI